jgi:hypothetical protein
VKSVIKLAPEGLFFKTFLRHFGKLVHLSMSVTSTLVKYLRVWLEPNKVKLHSKGRLLPLPVKSTRIVVYDTHCYNTLFVVQSKLACLSAAIILSCWLKSGVSKNTGKVACKHSTWVEVSDTPCYNCFHGLFKSKLDCLSAARIFNSRLKKWGLSKIRRLAC